MGEYVVLLIIAAALLVFVAYNRSKMIESGEILDRKKDFAEYAEIFTTKPIPSDVYWNALQGIDLNKTAVKLSGNADQATFSSSAFFTAKITKIESTESYDKYRFEFTHWKSKYGRPKYEEAMNRLITRTEKMFLELDPATKLETEKNDIKTKRSVF